MNLPHPLKSSHKIYSLVTAEILRFLILQKPHVVKKAALNTSQHLNSQCTEFDDDSSTVLEHC